MKLGRTPSVTVQKVKNEIGYSYITIKATRSRINKGLLAIPISLLDRFPKEKQKIYKLFYDDLAGLAKDNFEKTVFEYFDFISWTESKMQNVPYRRVVEEKAR